MTAVANSLVLQLQHMQVWEETTCSTHLRPVAFSGPESAPHPYGPYAKAPPHSHHTAFPFLSFTSLERINSAYDLFLV